MRKINQLTITDEKFNTKESDWNNVGKLDVDFGQLSSCGLNCLHVACANGNIEIASYLLNSK